MRRVVWASACGLLALCMDMSVASENSALQLRSSVDFGWTSNAEGMAGGGSDSFAVHRHAMSYGIEDGTYALRASLDFGQTRHLRLWQNDEWLARTQLEAEWRHGSDHTLSSSLELSIGEEGQAITVPDSALLGVTTPYLKARYGLAANTDIGALSLGADLAVSALHHAQARFSGATIAPARTRADMMTFETTLRAGYALSPDLKLDAQLRGLIQTIDAADQDAFGRIPLQLIRIAGGVSYAQSARAGFSLHAGADFVFPQVPDLAAVVLPHAQAEMVLALGGGLSLDASLRTSLDFESPTDGFLDALIEARTGLGLEPAQGARLALALFAKAIRSVGFDVEHRTERGLELSGAWQHEGFPALGLALVYRTVDGLMPGFDETRLRLTIAAAL